MSGRWAFGAVLGCLAAGLVPAASAQPLEEKNWKRIDSRYCTIWLHPEVTVKQVTKRISTWRVRPSVKASAKGGTPEEELAVKCDTIFRKAEEILDMYPAGIHTTIRISKHQEEIKQVHVSRFGVGTEAIAFYVFENNTVYTTGKKISESVLTHEMAHSIIDHYFRIRPPRKIEEMLAIHVDAHLRD